MCLAKIKTTRAKFMDAQFSGAILKRTQYMPVTFADNNVSRCRDIENNKREFIHSHLHSVKWNVSTLYAHVRVEEKHKRQFVLLTLHMFDCKML